MQKLSINGPTLPLCSAATFPYMIHSSTAKRDLRGLSWRRSTPSSPREPSSALLLVSSSLLSSHRQRSPPLSCQDEVFLFIFLFLLVFVFDFLVFILLSFWMRLRAMMVSILQGLVFLLRRLSWITCCLRLSMGDFWFTNARDLCRFGLVSGWMNFFALCDFGEGNGVCLGLDFGGLNYLVLVVWLKWKISEKEEIKGW